MAKLSVPAIILWVIGLIVVVFVMFFLAASFAVAFVGLLLIIAFFIVNDVFGAVGRYVQHIVQKITLKKKRRR